MPESMHRKLKARAAGAGLSLSGYLLRELRKSAEQPTVPESSRGCGNASNSNPKRAPRRSFARSARAGDRGVRIRSVAFRAPRRKNLQLGEAGAVSTRVSGQEAESFDSRMRADVEIRER